MKPRAVLIPGGVSGIGRAVALRCLRDGWSVAVCHRGSHEASLTLRDEAARMSASDRLVTLVCDVTDEAARAELIAGARERFGVIDALVHAAGPFSRGALLTQGLDAWRDAWESNVGSLIALTQALVPAMTGQRWGRVVGFASAGVERLSPAPSVAAYVSAKAAVVAFLRAVARETASSGVTANVVSPGVIDTGGVAPEVLAAQLPKVPAGRAGTPEEAAAVVAFLLSEEAGYVTGANVEVAGAFGL